MHQYNEVNKAINKLDKYIELLAQKTKEKDNQINSLETQINDIKKELLHRAKTDDTRLDRIFSKSFIVEFSLVWLAMPFGVATETFNTFSKICLIYMLIAFPILTFSQIIIYDFYRTKVYYKKLLNESCIYEQEQQLNELLKNKENFEEVLSDLNNSKEKLLQGLKLEELKKNNFKDVIGFEEPTFTEEETEEIQGFAYQKKY